MLKTVLSATEFPIQTNMSGCHPITSRRTLLLDASVNRNAQAAAEGCSLAVDMEIEYRVQESNGEQSAEIPPDAVHGWECYGNDGADAERAATEKAFANLRKRLRGKI